MLFKISWRNIWRSRTRSIVVILSISIGVWALSFVLSFSNGITYTYIKNAIREQYSHLQMHHPDFPVEKNSKFVLGNASQLLSSLRQMPEIEAVTSRVITTGMAKTTRAARGVQIVGIDPANEAAVTVFPKHLTQGEYLSASGITNQILLSERLAEKLKVKLRSKMVLTFQNMDGDITDSTFRVSGVFKTGNMLVDESTVYVLDMDLKDQLVPYNKQASLMGLPSESFIKRYPSVMIGRDIANEIAIYLKNPDDVASVKAQLKAAFPDTATHKIEDYWELSPDVELIESQIVTTNTIVITIFMLALIFGIINTMLMAVLERYKELGMLQAIGMKKGPVFGMIVLETLLLAAVAAPFGLCLGYLTVLLLQDTGIDLSNFAAGLERFGMDTTVFPVLDFGLYAQIAVAVFITALLASLYPARKAVKLRPVEALHKV